jgi:hypothetical protein
MNVLKGEGISSDRGQAILSACNNLSTISFQEQRKKKIYTNKQRKKI